jgi:hypothetical protein
LLGVAGLVLRLCFLDIPQNRGGMHYEE